MTLNIGDQRIYLTVPFDHQEFVRDVEAEVDGLFKRWRRNFPARTDKEIFAMVAYQFASYYSEMRERFKKASAIAGASLDLLNKADGLTDRMDQGEDDDFED